MPPTDLSALSRAGASTSVPRPPSRLATRVVLPAAIVAAALGLLAYAARESFRTTIVVTVAPVVLRAPAPSDTPDAARPGPEEVIQAPGWIEPDPSAISVPAIAPGVVRQVLVFDGDRVSVGQAVAELIDDDARLALSRAEAQATRAAAAVTEARAAVVVEESRAAEARDASDRTRNLVGTGAMAEGDIAALHLRLASQLAAVATARAAVARAEAEERLAQVGIDEANLALSRMTVRSPVAGVVLQRLIEPGQRLMPDANNPFAGVVVRVYDPARLQVRVDVPIADAAKVHIGDAVEITTETLAGQSFKGTLTRFVHETNLQKNTVQVKVSITDPAPPPPELKPDMLAKARITARSTSAAIPAGSSQNSPAGDVVIAPRSALIDVSDSRAAAWVVDRITSTAVKHTLRLGRVTDLTAEVIDGLRPGDRVITNPPADLRPGLKVRPDDEKEVR